MQYLNINDIWHMYKFYVNAKSWLKQLNTVLIVIKISQDQSVETGIWN